MRTASGSFVAFTRSQINFMGVLQSASAGSATGIHFERFERSFFFFVSLYVFFGLYARKIITPFLFSSLFFCSRSNLLDGSIILFEGELESNGELVGILFDGDWSGGQIRVIIFIFSFSFLFSFFFFLFVNFLFSLGY